MKNISFKLLQVSKKTPTFATAIERESDKRNEIMVR